MDAKRHWDGVYLSRDTDEVSWYQSHAERSLELIQRTGVGSRASIIDVGGGASTLVDDLLSEGQRQITVLDLAGTALQAARARLGDRASEVQWWEADILEAELPENGYDLWHDRAVFHFLTSADDRRAYADVVRHALKPGGFLIVATFAEDGPAECSGLPVMRYRPEELQAEFGAGFELVDQEKEQHQTPSGVTQSFVYCLFRRIESS
ncbi:methyltransferase family protein [Halospina denitrificans]|uniref:Methyltransferase family protein n=1 Tax=Halospina denitrificans TaxID=332522 RepID=A0A4R7JR92_9GAMM|nr:class I SAM-dependent methyltransferase [Halospina denitrificans]TDT40236.1 methyltransferase family protein [Halospina denitrificans]